MKKLNSLLIILIGLGLWSCSSDENSDIKKDAIVGTWKPVKSVEVYNNGNEDIYNYSNCEQQSRYTFEIDGNIKITQFYENENGNCVEDGEGFKFVSGQWEIISENRYKFTTTYFYDETQQNETETNTPDEITFPNQNTMRIRFNEGVEFNGVILEYYYNEFVRVK